MIDCQPSLGLLTINALACANSVLIPLECEYFAMRGVALLMETIDKVQQRLNPDLALMACWALCTIRALCTPVKCSERRERLRRQGISYGNQPHRAVPGRYRCR